MKKRLALAVVAGLTAVVVSVASLRADPELPNVQPHRHYIRQANGDFTEVGPQVCDNPNLQRAFNQFHNNIHVATSASIGPAAPGLHNMKGAEIFSRTC
jgi:hypothetical protein